MKHLARTREDKLIFDSFFLFVYLTGLKNFDANQTGLKDEVLTQLDLQIANGIRLNVPT